MSKSRWVSRCSSNDGYRDVEVTMSLGMWKLMGIAFARATGKPWTKIGGCIIGDGVCAGGRKKRKNLFLGVCWALFTYGGTNAMMVDTG